MIKDSKKHVGEKLVMAFAEFTSTYFATEAMDRLQARVRGGRRARGHASTWARNAGWRRRDGGAGAACTLPRAAEQLAARGHPCHAGVRAHAARALPPTAWTRDAGLPL